MRADHAVLSLFPQSRPVSLPDEQLPFISVVVPARNEGGKVGRCVESLAKQNYPNYEVIAINDRSVDDTGVVIKSIAERYPHVRYVYGQEAPPGWIGKCNALVHGVKGAGGQWFPFTDADTVHTPDSLRLAVSYAIKHNAELISFMPVKSWHAFWKKVDAQYPFFRNAIRANQSVQCFVIGSTRAGRSLSRQSLGTVPANSPDRMPRGNSTRN